MIHYVESKGCIELADALKLNRTLTKLDVSGNNMGDEGALALSDSLRFNPHLMHLDIASFQNYEFIRISKERHILRLLGLFFQL